MSTTTAAARPTSRRWSRDWLSVGRRLSRNDQENNFPKSPMHPSHLNSIPTATDNGANSPLPMPERAMGSNGPIPARLAIPRPSSEMIAAEIRRATTPSHTESRRGSEGSTNQQQTRSSSNSPSNSTSNSLTQELEKMKTAKVWWWQRDDVLKARMSSVIMAGLLLSVFLAIYLSLILTNNLRTQQTHVLVIMLLVLVGVFFCHTLARLCIAVIRPQPTPDMSQSPSRDLEAQSGIPFTRGPGGYAIPAEPIPVTFPDKQTVTTVPPPAYGLWRHSVRVNPDQFYWVRRESQPSSDEEEAAAAENGNLPPPPLTPLSMAPSAAEGEGVSRRPPSYISEDGVSYVLSAAAARQSRALARQDSVSSNLTMETAREGRGSLDSRRFRPTHVSSSPRASMESARRPPRLDLSPPRGSLDSRRLV
ncbi:hypothetical protein DFH27DRAFT_102820 [Peziza echinospora]|nr:hypothetical protein DFH27DRAFT_102820 [Peziza echinospora]